MYYKIRWGNWFLLWIYYRTSILMLLCWGFYGSGHSRYLCFNFNIHISNIALLSAVVFTAISCHWEVTAYLRYHPINQGNLLLLRLTEMKTCKWWKNSNMDSQTVLWSPLTPSAQVRIVCQWVSKGTLPEVKQRAASDQCVISRTRRCWAADQRGQQE